MAGCGARRSGSVCLNSFHTADKWFRALVYAAAGIGVSDLVKA